MGEDFEVTIDASQCTKEDVLEILKAQRTESNEGQQIEEDLSEEFTVSDWQDVPEFTQDDDFRTLSELMPVYENSHYDIEVFEAAHDAGIQFSDVEEAYSGQFSSDEKFAQDMADQLGAVDKNATWPNTCIDWERAARELMYDYCESNGHYFRSI